MSPAQHAQWDQVSGGVHQVSSVTFGGERFMMGNGNQLKLSAIAPLRGLLIARRSLKYLATAQRFFPWLFWPAFSISAPKT